MPRADGSPRLPTDLPPGARAHLGPTNMAGLVTHHSPGQVFVPLYAPPWAPWQSTVFPQAQPSAVAPNGLRPAQGAAVNTYSPIGHRNALRDRQPPRAIRAGGVARPTQRPRPYALGYATRWPQSAPRWPSFAESPNAAPGGAR